MSIEDRYQRELSIWMDRAELAGRRDPIAGFRELLQDQADKLDTRGDPISAYGWRKLLFYLGELEDLRATLDRLREDGVIDKWNQPIAKEES